MINNIKTVNSEYFEQKHIQFATTVRFISHKVVLIITFIMYKPMPEKSNIIKFVLLIWMHRCCKCESISFRGEWLSWLLVTVMLYHLWSNTGITCTRLEACMAGGGCNGCCGGSSSLCWDQSTTVFFDSAVLIRTHCTLDTQQKPWQFMKQYLTEGLNYKKNNTSFTKSGGWLTCSWNMKLIQSNIPHNNGIIIS